ncbi:MAG: hydrogenase nickel incorporation protein HypB [Acidaminococcaceae bacterium]|nr:hydrogenase nickel incorporation protein HypB [Acidaminococcaceae bacterium]
MHMMKADVMVDIHARNNHIAEHVHEYLAERHVFAVNLMGAPGAGKTTTLENLLKHLGVRGYVIEGDIESDIDTERLRKQQIAASQINTFGACHLDAPLVHNAIHTMQFAEPGILFIENVGNLVCPAEFSIGEDIKLLQVSVTDVSDKPYKYPLAFEKADIIILNKIDLMPYVDFDETFFMDGIRHLNKKAPVFKVSGKTGEGYAEAAAWIKQRAGF